MTKVTGSKPVGIWAKALSALAAVALAVGVGGCSNTNAQVVTLDFFQ